MALNVRKLTGILVLTIFVALAAFLIGYFKFLVICILVSFVLALIGGHLMSLLRKVRIGSLHIAPSLAAGVVLAVIVGVVTLLLYLVLPLLISQIMQLVNMDTSKIVEYANNYGVELRRLLIDYGIIDDTENSFELLVNNTLLDIIRTIDLKKVMTSTVSTTANLLMGMLTILFLTYFFLRDRSYWRDLLYSAVPDNYTDEVHNIFSNSRRLISRYFIGLLCEMILVTLLLFVGFTIFGFPNAFLIAAICGVMVVIPYLGAVIGSVFSFVILLVSTLNVSTDGVNIMQLLFTFYGIFIVAKLIDDFVMQPLIYSKSVKAHPVEIFLVILVAGKIGGVLGMIAAIPAYTLIRIFVKEFWSNSKFVKNLIKDL